MCSKPAEVKPGGFTMKCILEWWTREVQDQRRVP